MNVQRAFWLEEEFDREHAPDGHSRYGFEVRHRVEEFSDSWGDIAPVTFAVTAWRLATGLSPAYVRWHRRIVSAVCRRNAWDGGLTCAVTLAAPWPAELTVARYWHHDRGWRDWPRVVGQYVTPSEQDLARVPHLRASLLVEAPVPLDDLPAAPEGPGGEVAATAHRAMMVLTRELNGLLTPMIGQLEAGVPAR